jgi:hypothetical protein
VLFFTGSWNANSHGGKCLPQPGCLQHPLRTGNGDTHHVEPEQREIVGKPAGETKDSYKYRG